MNTTQFKSLMQSLVVIVAFICITVVIHTKISADKEVTIATHQRIVCSPSRGITFLNYTDTSKTVTFPDASLDLPGELTDDGFLLQGHVSASDIINLSDSPANDIFPLIHEGNVITDIPWVCDDYQPFKCEPE